MLAVWCASHTEVHAPDDPSLCQFYGFEIEFRKCERHETGESELSPNGREFHIVQIQLSGGTIQANTDDHLILLKSYMV